MSSVFLHLLNISITAGWIVLVVVLLRFVLKKAPKWIRVALWGLVAVRLLLPVSIESVLSLVPSAETVAVEPVTYEIVQVRDSNPEPIVIGEGEGERIVLHSGFEALNSAVNPVILQTKANTVTVLKTVAGWVWLSGTAAMLLYALVSYLRLRHRVRASVKLEKGVYVCDEIGDPFILGLIVPKVCLPSGMDETTRGYVLAHEKAHLKRFDHIWKPLGFLLLAVYWFNPLLWLAYILLCRDIELACDEKVVKEYDAENKAAYSEALLKSSVSRRSIAACPLAFGETGVKSRVKSILNYKKPAFWIILVALLAGIVVAVCFLTVPKKNKQSYTEFVGTWEFYKLIDDTYEEDALIATMLDGNIDRITFQEGGTGTWLYVASAVKTFENPFTYTVSGNKVFITRTGKDKKPLEFTYDPESGMLRSTEDAGEGHRWYTLFVRESSITYPTVQLTNEQIAGEWITDGLPIMEGKPLTLTGSLVFDTDGTAVLHLHGDNNTEMNVTGTYKTENGVIRFETDDDTAVLEYLSYLDMDVYFHLYIKDIKPEGENAFLASYDPQTDTIRIVVLHFGVLTFRRATPALSSMVMQWLDYYSASNQMPWEEMKEIAIDAFPNVTFRWTSGSVEAVESDKTRTLFTGMPVWNVFFADVTGDGKPELCTSVSFGSGIVDEHIVVYDYANRQSYTLWDRGTFDYHLYTENGALLVGKTLCNSYSSDTSILDTGTLMMHDGVLCCRWSDGSVSVLNRELHESELYGKWLVEEDANDPRTSDARIEYDFSEDGTVVFRQTPLYASYEFAFGYPVDYRYAVYDNYVHIEDGCSCTGYYDVQSQTLRVNYQPSPGQYVYATLRRMGEDASVAEKTYVGEWELVKIVDGRQEYDLAFLTAASGLENNRVILRADGTGNYLLEITGSESEDIGLTYAAADDENTVTVRFAEEMAYGYTMIARYDPGSDTLSMYYPDDPTMYSVYCRAGSIQDDPAAELTIEMLVGKWVTEGNIMYDPPFLPGTLTFLEDGSASLWLDGYLRSGEALDFQTALTGNMVYFSGYLSGNTFASYDAKTDTLRLRLPLASAGTLVFTRDHSANAPQTLEEILLGTYVCTGAKQNELSIPVPAVYVGMTIDLGDTSGAESYRHVASVTIGGTKKEGYDWKVDENDILIVGIRKQATTCNLNGSQSKQRVRP